MDTLKDFLMTAPWRLIDHTTISRPAWESFAIDDALVESMNHRQSEHTIRLWRHDPTVVLGIADARLPHLNEAVDWLKKQGYQPVVRNSGGLAVVLDKGVLNLSLLLSNGDKIGIHEGYQYMVNFIQAIFADWTDQIQAFEVAGSYCPGDYDLSINGKKFAGISQRRVRKGIAIQIYLSIEADEQRRAKLIQTFYQYGIQNEDTRFAYPKVKPETMEALATLLNRSITVTDVVYRIKSLLNKVTPNLTESSLLPYELDFYYQRRQQMIDRNKKALGSLFE